MDDILTIRNLCVAVDGRELLHRLNLTIPAGEVHALLGPNGCGKTTLMMTIMGYTEYPVIPISCSMKSVVVATRVVYAAYWEARR